MLDYNIKQIFLLSLSLLLVGCSDTIAVLDKGEEEVNLNDPITFSTLLPEAKGTRAMSDAESLWRDVLDTYKPFRREYELTVEMWKGGTTPSCVGQSTYLPIIPAEGETPTTDTLQLKQDETPLYWQDNSSLWGFKAYANKSDKVSPDQADEDAWYSQDYIEGYSYLPIWSGESATDDFNAINYRTSKQWYKGNKTAKELSGIMVTSEKDYKKVPLYMQHKRAWITLIVKASEGVTRESLAFENSERNLHTSIFSYPEGKDPTSISGVWSREEFIDYGKDVNGEAATGVSTTRYDVIVDPHDYRTNTDEQPIARINLSDQFFTYYVSSDPNYSKSHATVDESDTEAVAVKAAAQKAMEAYDLSEGGKHLTIIATLSRQSRKILITAEVAHWYDMPYTTICDDYGSSGKTIEITSRESLKTFLEGPDNKAGSVALVNTKSIILDTESETWPSDYTLNASLNLAGCTFETKSRVFKEMASSACLINGTILVKDDADISSAVAGINYGTIDHIDVVTSGELSTAKAYEAGLVSENHGTITQCSSSLPVYGKTSGALVGGIAQQSFTTDAGYKAIIESCTVNASIKGVDGVTGGGIVGKANGIVSNNTFEYGISVSQPSSNVGADAAYFKNIFASVYATNANVGLVATGNSWPTTADNIIGATAGSNPNNYSFKYGKPLFVAVIDCQEELETVMGTSYNTPDYNIRISKSFTVNSEWNHGFGSGPLTYDFGSNNNNVTFNLDGNNKTITLTGTKKVLTTDGGNLADGNRQEYTTAPMLFTNVLGQIKDLTLYLDKPIVSEPTQSEQTIDGNKVNRYDNNDAIAPLAYSVYGPNAKLDNVSVKAAEGVFVQSASPAGLVVWAANGATVSNCRVKVPVRMWHSNTVQKDRRYYAGGIICMAASATIFQCEYLMQGPDPDTDPETVSPVAPAVATADQSNYYYGGIVGGTSKFGDETPQLQIIDCTSWFSAKRQTADHPDKASCGSIIAYSAYNMGDAQNTQQNGMNAEKPSEGNWWPQDAVGVHSWASGLNETKVIGPRNSAPKIYDEDF